MRRARRVRRCRRSGRPRRTSKARAPRRRPHAVLERCARFHAEPLNAGSTPKTTAALIDNDNAKHNTRQSIVSGTTIDVGSGGSIRRARASTRARGRSRADRCRERAHHLGEQLTGEPPSPGAERRAKRDFSRARGRPGQHDAGDIRAGYGQDQRDQHHQCAGETKHDIPVPPARENGSAFNGAPDRPDAASRSMAWPTARLQRPPESNGTCGGSRPPAITVPATRCGPHREPEIAGLDPGALEARRRDADHGDRPVVDPQRPADHASSPLNAAASSHS